MRGGVVVCQQLGVVVLTSERLDPSRGAAVLLGALDTRDLAVRDIPDEYVPESVFGLSGD